MCSLFGMENYQGDLTDIVRASSVGAYSTSNSTSQYDPISNWQQQQQQFPSHQNNSHPINFSSTMEVLSRQNFGDPFSSIRDPLLQHHFDISTPPPPTPKLPPTMCNKDGFGCVVADVVDGGGDGANIVSQRPCNIFSRMLQISPSTNKLAVSPCDSSPVLMPNSSSINNQPAASGLVQSDHMINANSSSTACIGDTSGLLISSPRNQGLKRRKSQAKKVVCIPAPAPANSRPSGEVVPSDLWAWRKYGQKPIKGSPYPRGYYRCSSSKGCSARKQVERSRTDPNMLVITYTSEHNHPWPTQRNALAGSTRSQPIRNTSSSNRNSPPKDQDQDQQPKEKHNNNDCSINGNVKEEMREEIEKRFEIDHDDEFSEALFPSCYDPTTTIMASGSNSNHSDDFFADLGEIETDPLNLIFSQAFPRNEQKDGKALDPLFSLFDWTGDNPTNSTNTNNSSFDESSKRGL